MFLPENSFVQDLCRKGKYKSHHSEILHLRIDQFCKTKLTLTLKFKIFFQGFFFTASYSTHHEDKKSQRNRGSQLNRSLGKRC